LSKDPSVASLFPDRTESPTPPAPTIPPLDVRIIKARKLQKPRHLRRVTPERNVVGHRPLEIAFLRLFENQPRMRTFIQGAWREFGYVHLLRSAASVTPGEYRWAKRSGGLASLFATSRDRLAVELDRCQSQPHRKGWYRLKGIASSTIWVRDKYGGYPPCAILCHGTFWRTAVDVLLERVDVVAFDLSGLTGENEGTLYELHRVIDRFPIEHVVFLADERTNRTFVTNVLEQAWANMAAESPNAVTSPKTAAVVITDYVQRHTTQTTTGQGASQTTTTQVQIKLVAKRRQTRRVVKMAQDRMDGLIQ
jgi:hypothetical protein